MPYMDRLTWTARDHVATRKGRSVVLAAAPDLGHGQVAECDHIPSIHLHQVRRLPSDRVEDMEPDEIAAAQARLREAVPSGPAPL